MSTLPTSSQRRKHPSWIKARFFANERYEYIAGELAAQSLHTVCQEAECPNIGECWSHGTATFMLLGDTCTRACRFCAVASGRPKALDPREPEKVADLVAKLELDYVVLTSVDRDDLPDEGAGGIASTIEAIVARRPSCRVEALVPDFHARRDAIARLVGTPLLVFAHNVETVPRLYGRVRPGSVYERSLAVLAQARELALDSAVRGAQGPLLTKSSLMLGLGETRSELGAVCKDLRAAGVDILTLGQYLQPTAAELEVFRYLPPAEFDDLRREALALGFRQVIAGSMVRSSYHAWEAVDAVGPVAEAGLVAEGGPAATSELFSP